MATDKYDYGLGRRKSATARARLTAGKGAITINGKTADEYLSGNKTLLAEITDPLATVNKQKTVEMPTETTIRIRTTIHQQEIPDRKDSGISTTL